MSNGKLKTGSILEITSAKEGLRFGKLKDLDDGKEYLFEMYEDGDKISEEDIQILAEGDLVTYKSEYDDDMEQDIAYVAKLNK
tara:strand:+ start:317 stop:565 length:249 start_codon:yes stop_codon:yes gene_type:complete